MFASLLALALLGAEPAPAPLLDPKVEDTWYGAAYRASVLTRKPLMVVVGAKWCPACQQYEQVIIPEARRRGLFNRVVLVEMDYDKDKVIVAPMVGTDPIPVTVIYPDPRKPRRIRFIGIPTIEVLDGHIKSAIEKEPETATPPQPKQTPDTRPVAK